MVDRSASGSPLTLSGTVTLAETLSGDTLTFSQGENLTARNVGSKSILALKFDLRVVYPSGESGSHITQWDRFFRPDVIAPGGSASSYWPPEAIRKTISIKGTAGKC